MTPASKPALICRNVTKSYQVGDEIVTAAHSINLDVNQGDIFMLVGPSGCGKTTLISIMAGMLHPDSGTCRVFDTELTQLSANALVQFRAKNIGFVFQNYNLLPALTIAENVAIPLIIKGHSETESLRRATAILGELELGDRVQSRPPELSGGQQQRVAIARALVHEPGLLVCDEPTSALDHAAGAHIMELLCRAVHQRHATLVIVTHDNRIFDYADHIAHMEDGHIIHGGDIPPTLSPAPVHPHAL